MELIEVGSLEFWEILSPFKVPVSRQLGAGKPQHLTSFETLRCERRMLMARLGFGLSILRTSIESLRPIAVTGQHLVDAAEDIGSSRPKTRAESRVR